MTKQLMTFSISGERFAILLEAAREVVRCEPIAPVPTLPAWIRGVMGLRTGAIPVVDLAVKFGRERSALTTWSCVIIVHVRHGLEDTVLGLLIDEVGTLVEQPIQKTPEFGAPVKLEFLSGVVNTEAGLALVLDLDRVLSIEELLTATSAVAAGEGGRL
jgi:purine-binding chemotaxis protein CheW